MNLVQSRRDHAVSLSSYLSYNGEVANARVLCGVAGSGKTHRVLREALAALEQYLEAEQSGSACIPPLYIIVPEQQTLAVERQLLEIMQAQPARRQAFTGLQVTSFTRLGRQLSNLTAPAPAHLSELGRRLMAWRLLPKVERQPAKVNELAGIFAELEQFGAEWEDVGRVARLAGGQAHEGQVTGAQKRLENKLEYLSEHYRAYCAWCQHLGLQVRNWAGEITLAALRKAEANPQADANPFLRFSQARIWLDGFMGLTTPELSAAQALLQSGAHVTLTLLLDPVLVKLEPEEQAAHQLAEWYFPTQELLAQWRIACRDAGVELGLEVLDGTPPRYTCLELARIAAQPVGWGSAVAEEAIQPVVGRTASARAFTCSSQRNEVDLACNTVLELVRERGWRFGDICVLTRDANLWAPLLATRFADFGIAAHIDARAGLGGHPLVEYVKCSLRLAVGNAQPSDVTVLLGTRLLPRSAPEDESLLWRLDYLVRQRRYRASKWLDERCWESGLTQERVDTREQLLDPNACLKARLTAFAPVMELRNNLPRRKGTHAPAADVLAHIWHCLLGTDLQERLAADDLQVLEQLALLWDEVALVGEGVHACATGASEPSVDASRNEFVDWEQFQQWLEFGLDQLSLRSAPLAVDQLIVADVEDSRVPPVKAVLVLGLAEDSWQPRLGAQRYFTEDERAAVQAFSLNSDDPAHRRTSSIIAPGAAAIVEREAYLALIAATRAAEFIQFSYANLDRERNPRRPSRYFHWLCEAFSVEACEHRGIPGGEPSQALAAIWHPREVALLAVSEDPVIAPEQLLALLPSAVHELIDWRRKAQEPALVQQHIFWRRKLLKWSEEDGGPLLTTSATQLETYANCPYQYYAKYLANLNEPDDPELGHRLLGSLYHNVLLRLLTPVADEVCLTLAQGGSPAPVDWAQVARHIPECIDKCMGELELHEDIQRVEFVKARCRSLLTYLLGEYARADQTGLARWPLQLEAAFGKPGGLVEARLDLDDYRVALQGKLDRVDLTGEQRPAVVDYKLGQRKIDAWKVSAGLELQLPVYLLALRGPVRLITGLPARTWPQAQAEYQPLEFAYKDGQAQLTPAQLPTPTMIRAAQQEGLDAAAAVLGYALEVIKKSTAAMHSLACPPQPARSPSGDWTACQHCAFQPLCRFDALAGGRYRQAAHAGGRDHTALRAWLADGMAHCAGKERA